VNIVVLVKQVPDSEAMVQVKANGSGVDIEEKYTLNFFDSLALEEALQIKEKIGSGKVTLITLGTQKSVEALRTGIAMGADEAFLLEDQALMEGDEYTTAKALAKAINGMDYDLVFCGKEAFDDSSGAVGPIVAEFLGIPHVTSVVKVDVSSDEQTVTVEREIEGGKEIIKAGLPVLLASQKGLNEPRVPPITGVMKAMREEVKRLDLNDIDVSPGEVGRQGAKEEIVRFYRPPKRPPVTMIEGEMIDVVRELVKFLKEKIRTL